MSVLGSVFDFFDTWLAWLTVSLKQTTGAYVDIATADSDTVIVTHSGGLGTVIKIQGVTYLVGQEEFNFLHEGFYRALQIGLKKPGHAFQFFFSYDRENVRREIANTLKPARDTLKKLNLDLEDLLIEREKHLANFCATEGLYLVLWTYPNLLSAEQQKRAGKEKAKFIREHKIPNLKSSQNFMAAIPDLRNNHDAFVKSIINDLTQLGIACNILHAHEALRAARNSADPDFTDEAWRPVLPGDKIPIRDLKKTAGEISDILWPPLGKQLIPRDGENLDLRTCRIGDKIYSSVFIDLFPQEIRPFNLLLNRVLASEIPWRISFFVQSNGLPSLRFKALIASILSFASPTNRLLHDATQVLNQLEVTTDDCVVKLQVVLTTWAELNDLRTLRVRTATLAKAVEGWGSCEVSEICGDAFQGVVSSMLAITTSPVSTIAVAPLSDVTYMLPFTRPASPWHHGAVLFRSPDGKLWPYQPGSSQQTTWIDLIYARPGSGKSVLSNAMNLALCMAPGVIRLPIIKIIDIGPSSSGCTLLIREALPPSKRHFVAHHRIHMLPQYTINPFDTRLGYRYPTAQERAFLVNFLTLLSTPLGVAHAYDGISDMVGLVINELYHYFSDEGNPRAYTPSIEPTVDDLLLEISFVRDTHTTWWEITDALFIAGFTHEAQLAQRYAMPLLADAASICRTKAVEDLYGRIIAPTGEPLIMAFSRMISGAVREYPILSRPTVFDLGDTRIVSIDLDEVAKSGGDAADRQTAIMYMLARYILAKDFYLTTAGVDQLPAHYQSYHNKLIEETKEDQKRLVYDEFHRTARTQAVRDQVLVDMREGRKWNVQIALISQSLDDFDQFFVEFATSIFIMDAGPEQTINRSQQVFGLSETARNALKTRVHGPRQDGVTFLAQFATKQGKNTQLLTNTIGPIELWSFTTTTEDVILRDHLYRELGSITARKVLAKHYPNGTVKPVIEKQLEKRKEEKSILTDEEVSTILEEIAQQLIMAAKK